MRLPISLFKRKKRHLELSRVQWKNLQIGMRRRRLLKLTNTRTAALPVMPKAMKTMAIKEERAAITIAESFEEDLEAEDRVITQAAEAPAANTEAAVVATLRAEASTEEAVAVTSLAEASTEAAVAEIMLAEVNIEAAEAATL